MKYVQKEKNGVVVGYIDGEINIETVPYFKTVLEKMIISKVGNVILNFEKVVYIDSMGIASILTFIKKHEGSGAKTAFCNIQPKLFSIFKITKLDRVLRIFDTEEEALKELSEG
ncbi:MAG TPA: STAS domain-containing protein [Candidatus Omnitrophota bacterium]|nr:STAS domain-containing protein [Candidatus Omnitrophota bacterium]